MARKSTISITLPEPCGEDWNAMTPNGCGRFCASCQKTVTDFTVMTDAQIIDIFRNSKTTPCGRFFPEQLNRPLQEPETVKPFPFYRKMAAAILALQAFTVTTFAQGKKKPAVTAHDRKPQQQPYTGRVLKGELRNIKDQPVAHMQLVLTAVGYDSLYTTSDENGCWTIILPNAYATAVQLSAIDPDARQHPEIISFLDLGLDEETLHTAIVLRQFEATILPQAEITTTSITRTTYTGIAPVYMEHRKPTTWQKITKPFRKKHRR